MPRLPVPGSDDGQWGEILNAFLRVVHNDDGSLKTSFIPEADKGLAGGVAELDGGGKVPTSQLPAAALAGDATSTDKGVLRLAGDLGGTANSPTVPGLASKADSSAVLAKTSNLSDLDNFTQARQNLGVEIGVDVQAWDSTLDVWSGKAVPSGTVVGTSDTQTLTNKTLTSPVINTPTGLVKGDVDLGSVDNTADADKPISTATQTALDLKESLSNKSTDTALGTSNTLYPTQNAVKTYVDTAGGAYVPLTGGTMTGGLTLTSAATTGLVQYNTADQTTNYERIRGIWSSNAYYLGHEWAGTGSSRTLHLGVAASAGNSLASGSGRFISIKASTPFYSLNIGATGLTGNIFDYSGSTLAASSSTQTAFAVNPTINQSSTAGYTALLINPTESTVGSGSRYLLDVQVGSASRFRIESSATATNHTLVTAVNGSGDVALGIQNNATTANETASLLFYTTTNATAPFGRIRTTRVDGANSRISIAPYTGSALVNHIQMYGDTGLLSLGAGSTPANGLVTIGSDTTSVSGGLYFGTDTTLYRFGSNVLGTNSRLLINASSTGAIGFSVRTSGNANDRLQVLGSGTLQFGDGTAVPDTTLYRSAADTLKTDDNLVIAQKLTVGQSTLSSYLFDVTEINSTLSGTLRSMYFHPVYNPASDNGVALFLLAAAMGPAYNSTVNKSVGGSFLGGIYLNPTIQNTGGIPIKGIDINISNDNGATIPYYRGVDVRQVAPGAGTVTTAYGVYIGDMQPAGVTTGYGIYLAGSGTGNAINWAGDTNLYRSAANELRTDDNLIVAGATSAAGSVVTVDSTQSLSNKRLTPRITTITSSATPTINTDNCDAVTITALATAITSMTSGLSGTPVNFQKLMIRIKDDGTARSITWGASFASRGVTLPTTTVISKVLTVGLIYNSVTSTWDCVAVAQEA